MTLWLRDPEPRSCAECGEAYDWQLDHGSLVGTCLGCERDFTLEHADRYRELLDAHPDWPSDDLARIAAEDFNRWLLAAYVAKHT